MNRRSVLLILLFLPLVSCSLLSAPESGPAEPLPTLTVVPDSATGEALPMSPQPQETAGLSSFEPAATTASQPEQGSKGAQTAATSLIYGTQPGSPVRIASWLHDCNWMGVAGQVFAANGVPIDSIVVEAGGSLEGQDVLGLSITGIDNGYGPGGYEILLSSHVVASQNSLWVQLKDLAGQPLSPKTYLETAASCDQNLTLLNFQEGAAGVVEYIYYFPLIFH